MLSARQTLSNMFIPMIFREVDMDTVYMQLHMVMWCCRAKQPFKSRQSTWKAFEQKPTTVGTESNTTFPKPPWFFKPREIVLLPNNLSLKHKTSRHGSGRFTPRIRLRKKSGKKKTIPSGKLKWQWKVDLLQLHSLLKMVIFHCHVRSLEGTYTPREIQGTFVDFWGCCWNTKYDQIKFYVYFFLGAS